MLLLSLMQSLSLLMEEAKVPNEVENGIVSPFFYAMSAQPFCARRLLHAGWAWAAG
jgi:hypothetical protein